VLSKYAVRGKTNKLLGSEELALIAHVPLLQKCASWPGKRSAKINWLYWQGSWENTCLPCFFWRHGL